MHDGLRNLWANPADDAVRAHQSRGSNGLQQMLGHESIHRRHAGDIDDGDLRIRLYDALQQGFHHHLCPCAVESSYNG